MKDTLEDKFQAIVAYHEASKHSSSRFAASPGYMDWENQPDPFRLCEGTERIRLPLIGKDVDASYENLYNRENLRAKPFNLENIGHFLELSIGLSAWKFHAGEHWPLRMNPSSGNLHPTEAYLVLPQLGGLHPGVFHYSPLLHALERRATLKKEMWDTIRSHFVSEGFWVALTSIFWRESWKYGERAYRYCNHDVGHALAALSISANLLGWKMLYLNSLADEDIETILGLKKTPWHPSEEEHPDLMCFVFPADSGEEIPVDLPGDIVRSFDSVEFRGIPNKLSNMPVRWDIIYHTAEMARKSKTLPGKFQLDRGDFKREVSSRFSAAHIIRKRRSGMDFDIGKSQMDKSRFISLLDKTLPRQHCAPFDMALHSPCIHLLIFVHHVTGMDQGLYAFVRDKHDLPWLKEAFAPGFAWEPVTGDFPLFLLAGGNYRDIAAVISCEQEIAGHSAFSLGMAAKFRSVLRRQPFRYRHLFWEAGMVGQVLYLEAEANGLSGTGIGCFFDDEMHRIAGIQNNRYQSLYHFTVGTAIEDPRLTTLPPYLHRQPAEKKP